MFALCLNGHAAEPKAKYTIKWQMAHYPVRYFQQTAEAFRKEVSSKTNGEVNVEVSLLKVNPSDRKEFFDHAVERVQSGEITMAQVYTHQLAQQKAPFYLFSLPFLFENHGHMAAAMESADIGGRLLASLEDVGLKGLGFTYSGGYLVMLSQDKEFKKIEDLNNVQYRRIDNPVWQDALDALHVQHFPQNLRRRGQRLGQIEAFAQGLAEAADSTYADADLLMFNGGKGKPLVNVLNETKHTFLTTALIMNQKFFKALPANYQAIVQEAALNAARFERKIVMDEEVQIRKQVAAKFKIVTMVPDEVKRFKDAMKPVLTKWEPIVGAKMIEQTRKLKALNLAAHE